LQKALFLAFQQQKPVFTTPVPVPFNGASHRILISIHPYLAEPASAPPEPLALLFFLEEGAQPEPEATSEIAPAESVQEAQWLGELQYLHVRLRELSKQHLATHEELHLANEELKALNDENRSAIEELETSKEQLHSLNEELRTTNHHLQQRLTEISQAHSDIENLMTATDIPVLFLDNRLHIQRYTPAAKQLFPLQSTDLGRHISHLAHHLRYDDLVSDAQQVFNSLVSLAREVEDENGRWLLARHHPYRNFDNERIEGVVLSFVDISDLKWAETALRQSEARLAREVAALRRLHQMTVRVVTTSDRQQALDEILNAAVEILQSDFGNIQLLDQSRRTLSIAAQSGFEDAFLKRFQEVSAEDDTACGRALRQGQRVIISDVAVDAAYAPYLEMAQAAGYQATQSTPLINYRGEVLGMLSTHYRQPMSLTERDEQMLDLLAYQAANLIERLRAEDRLEYRVQQRTRQVRRLASELIAAEQTVRQRVAQTLHDDLQQTLFGAKVQLQFLQEEVGESETLTDLAELVSQCLKLTRHLTVELSPPILEEEGLPEALAWLGAHMRELYGLQVSFDVRDRPEMVSEEVRILLYQIVRELLFNVVKHAGVLEAEILLEQEADGLLLTVRDQGQGFDVATLVAETNASFGLRSIQERLQLFDGWAAVESEPGTGTRVQLFLPQVAPEKE
jgi:two-component system CheB/CheR fusion protein